MKENSSGSALLLESSCRKLLAYALAYKLPLLTSLVTGIIAHCFAFANKLVNIDDVGYLFSKGVTVSSGRWGLVFLKYLFPNISMPWIYGLITIVLISISVCIIISLFSIRNKLLQGLLAGTIMVFPSLTGLFGYMFTCSSYAVAFLLCVLSVLLLRKHSWRCTLMAIGFQIFSISIYQAYIAVTASLFLILMIQMLLYGEDVLTVVKRGLCALAFLVISILGYWIATKLLFLLLSAGFNGYAAERFDGAPASFLSRIIQAYKTFGDVLLHGEYGIIPTDFSRLLHIALLLCCGGSFLAWLADGTGKKGLRGASVLFLAFLLPLSINCILLTISLDGMHTLMQYGFISLYVLAAVLIDRVIACPPKKKAPLMLGRASANMASIALALVLAVNTYVANAAYFKLHLQYENTYSFLSSVLADMRARPDFTAQTRVAIIGPWEPPAFYDENLGFVAQLTGSSIFSWDDIYSYPHFMYHYLGVSIPAASEDEIAEIKATQAFADMSVYPYSGSMEMFGDILVVKLS